MNKDILPQSHDGDTSSLRQIPDFCRKLSPETIELLRKTKNGKRPEFTAAIAVACEELGIPSPNTVSKASNTNRGCRQAAWNYALDEIDAACPDWRGYTVNIDRNISKWVAS